MSICVFVCADMCLLLINEMMNVLEKKICWNYIFFIDKDVDGEKCDHKTGECKEGCIYPGLQEPKCNDGEAKSNNFVDFI